MFSSHSLAEYWKVAARLDRNPSRSAGFVVLKAPDVPSVLLELGFLSNDADVADLTSPEWRRKAAAQVAARHRRLFCGAHPPDGTPHGGAVTPERAPPLKRHKATATKAAPKGYRSNEFRMAGALSGML